MSNDLQAPVTLASFDPVLARAVAAVLRDAGCPAWTRPTHPADAGSVGEHAVLVHTGRREAAVRLLAARMDEVHERVRAVRLGDEDGGEAETEADAEARPLVLNRFRRLGGVALLLVPLLVVVGSAAGMPRAAALPILVLGIAALVALRGR